MPNCITFMETCCFPINYLCFMVYEQPILYIEVLIFLYIIQ